MIDAFIRLIEPLRTRVMLLASRFVVRKVDDTVKMQSMQIELLQKEVRDMVERFQEYGFTSMPHPGAEGIAVFPGGNRDHGLIIAVDDRRYRLTGLKDGEVAIYTDEGDKIHLKRGNIIEIVAATKVVATTPIFRIEGDLEVTGDVNDRVDSDGNTMEQMRTTYDIHTHPSGTPNTDVPNQQMG